MWGVYIKVWSIMPHNNTGTDNMFPHTLVHLVCFVPVASSSVFVYRTCRTLSVKGAQLKKFIF